MATKKTTPKAAAKPKTTAKKTPAKAAPKEAPKVEACPAPTVSALSSEDLAKFLALPKGYDSKEVSLVLQAATDYANEYIGKTPNPTHEYKMAIQLLAGKMYATGSLVINNAGEIPGKIRYFLEMVKSQ